jgi:hypothetical protein
MPWDLPTRVNFEPPRIERDVVRDPVTLPGIHDLKSSTTPLIPRDSPSGLLIADLHKAQSCVMGSRVETARLCVKSENVFGTTLADPTLECPRFINRIDEVELHVSG